MQHERYFNNTMPGYRHGELQIAQKEFINNIDNITAEILTDYPNTDVRCDLYKGTAGVAYMFYHLSKITALKEQRLIYLKNAVDYLRPALAAAKKNITHSKNLPGFLNGPVGIYSIASAVYHAKCESEQAAQYYQKVIELAPVFNENTDNENNDYYVGRAGYLCALLWVIKETGNSFPKQFKDQVYKMCNAMVNVGRIHAKKYRFKCPLMFSYHGKEYLGAAHGLCTILLMLISVPQYLCHFPAEAKDIKSTIDYLLSLQTTNGNFPSSIKEIRGSSRKDELVHWCHGAPGVIHLMAKAYIIWNEEKYLQSCVQCGKLIWEKGLLRKGPGICHGVSGNAYAFLLLYRLTNNKEYLHRATAFAHFMTMKEFREGARTPDSPYSLYEGIAGTACFLSDLTQPSDAYFPFLDIFTELPVE